MISGYISINRIIAKVYRSLDINYEIPVNDMVEFAAEALELIGVYGQYDEITDCITLANGKAKLPCGFHKLIDINYKQQPLYWASQSAANNYACHSCQVPICKGDNCGNTFYLNDSYLITNINNGIDSNLPDEDKSVCINYLGIHLDEDGFPMIPDDIYYQKAIESFIIHMIDYREWRKGKITDKVKDASEANWLFYVNSARGSGNMPNTAQLENLTSIMTRLMPMRREYSKNFRNMPRRENLNI